MTDPELETDSLFEQLSHMSARPRPFEFYTAETLWTDEHISSEMLKYHLNPDVDLASRKTDFIEGSAAWIAERFGLRECVSVADFGCGPGLYATRFAETGAAVTGVDFSERSLTHARLEAKKRGLAVDYVLADYLDFETDSRYDLITLIYCDLCALSPVQRAGLLAKFHALLKDGGSVLLDVCSMAAFDKWTESTAFQHRFMNGFWSPGDYYGFRVSFKYDREKVTLDRYTIVEPERRFEVYNWLQYFDVDSLRNELAAAGLRVVDAFSDVGGRPYDESDDQFAVVAVRS